MYVAISQLIYRQRHLKLKWSTEMDESIDIMRAVVHTPFYRKSLLVDMGTSAAKLLFQEPLNLGSHADVHHHNCLKDDLTEVSFENFHGNHKKMLLLYFFLLEKMEKCKSIAILFKGDCLDQEQSKNKELHHSFP
ncbi:hypothetical protein ACOSP7_002467 [Xanthoceras sorbifolium]